MVVVEVLLELAFSKTSDNCVTELDSSQGGPFSNANEYIIFYL